MSDNVYEFDSVPNAECTVNEGDVVRYFSADTSLDLRDLIVHIRSQFPNPHQKVLLKTDLILPTEDLAKQLIYVDGVNNDRLSDLAGVGARTYLPIEINADTSEDDFFGIHERIKSFTEGYGITDFDILFYGDNEKLVKVWDYVHGSLDVPYRCMFPENISRSFKLLSNGIDIAPYAEKLRLAHQRDDLTTAYLRSVVDELREKIREGKTALQDFEDTRSYYAKWLTSCLIQEFDLPPVYLGSYVAEYVALGIGYPFEKLSLFERIAYVNRLPRSVGYIGGNQEFMCIYQIMEKIFPLPAIAFDVATGEIIKDDLKRFSMDKLTIQDYRSSFKESKAYFSKQSNGLSASGGTDSDVDRNLAQIFAHMSAQVDDREVYLTVRNTIMAKFAGKAYVLYYDEPLGLVGVLQSEYFGSHFAVVKEEEFRYLIDARVVLAANQKDNATTIAQGNSEFKEIMVNAATTLKPAIPPFVLMCSELTAVHDNELSYYDKRLRCDKRIVPIVTHEDSELKRMPSVFDFLSLTNVMGDDVALPAMTAFGTINSSHGYNESLPVSIKTFKGCKLL